MTITNSGGAVSFQGASPITRGLSLGARPTRESVLQRLSEALMRRSLTMIDLSQRGLQPSDARLVKLALLQNASLTVLKLGYNNLGDEGAETLASGISAHGALKSLDLGFNNISNAGCAALASSLLSTRGALHTLYLAGNAIEEEGARALAAVMRQGCGLRRLHLTGNKIGAMGVEELIGAITDIETGKLALPPQQNGHKSSATIDSVSIRYPSQELKDLTQHQLQYGVHELFLGGTGMGRDGCVAVSRLLETSKSLRVLSLANCELGDDVADILSEAIKRNRKGLPLEILQLSFNNLSCKGVEALMNGIWGSTCLKELRLDNNAVSNRGAQVVSAVLGSVKTLTHLDLGFNKISPGGMKVLMKALAENQNLRSLSISGNPIDTGSAKAVAYALAYNRSLKALFLDHCSVGHEGQRHVTAGIVSNSGTVLQTLTGFRIGGEIIVTLVSTFSLITFLLAYSHSNYSLPASLSATAVSLGLPTALDDWTNEQVLKFIHLMWEQMRNDQGQNSEEKETDPLHLLRSLPGNHNNSAPSGPLDPATVVAVAKKAFSSIGPNSNALFSRHRGRPLEPVFESPIAEAVMLEDGVAPSAPPMPSISADPSNIDFGDSSDDSTSGFHTPNSASGRPPLPKSPASTLSYDERRKKMVGWLCKNIQHSNELANLPFNSSELWRLHQHFFNPLIFEGERSSRAESPHSMDGMKSIDSTISHANSTVSAPHAGTQSSDTHLSVPVSEPSLAIQQGGRYDMGNLSMLKRKVSYRTLHDAAKSNPARAEVRLEDANGASISRLIQDMSGHSMQPKSKKARRNRSRISFVPRVKAKLDSYLDTCHEKALILMRQLQYVERALLRGDIYPFDQAGSITHLTGILASDIEIMVLDLM
jgi:Ran GTPase-activating protein (RanGAP) involved in mRNA processing and transport